MVRIREGSAGLLYTADCVFKPGLVAANAAGCAVLIHEATYPDARLPAVTGHSSARQAGLAAAAAGVERLFLCHLDPSAWRGAGDPAAEARRVFSGEVIVPEPGTWYSVTHEKPRRKTVTVEDVARKCGLSRATVSRVLNGAARVRPATVERVQRAIAKLGYHPNAHARALSGGASGTLAVLLRGGAWRPYYSTLLEGIEEVASREGLHVLLRTRDYLAAAPRLVEEGRVDGFIIRNMDEPEAHLRLVARLNGRDVPFVLIGNPLGDWQSITIDNVGGARAMARHFAEHGFRRILFIAGPRAARRFDRPPVRVQAGPERAGSRS